MTRSPADVVIIGAGVVGTAIARALTAYSLDLMLVDAATDVGTGTSKANTAILHTGFDAKPGSLESRLLSRGSGLLREYASAARIPVERTGALLVAWTPDQVAALPGIEAAARRKMMPVHWAFVSSGVDDDTTVQANREGFRHVELRPRRLRDATRIDMRTDLFGATYDSPIFTCPTSGERLLDPDGELAVARATRKRGTMQMLSTSTST